MHFVLESIGYSRPATKLASGYPRSRHEDRPSALSHHTSARIETIVSRILSRIILYSECSAILPAWQSARSPIAEHSKWSASFAVFNEVNKLIVLTIILISLFFISAHQFPVGNEPPSSRLFQIPQRLRAILSEVKSYIFLVLWTGSDVWSECSISGSAVQWQSVRVSFRTMTVN